MDIRSLPLSALAERHAYCWSDERSSKRKAGHRSERPHEEAFHRALMAFPDEDVVVGGRFALPDALQALKEVDDVIPAPGSRAVGEERAWGRRLAKRFGVDGSYVAEQFMSTKNPSGGFVDFESAKPERLPPAQRVF